MVHDVAGDCRGGPVLIQRRRLPDVCDPESAATPWLLGRAGDQGKKNKGQDDGQCNYTTREEPHDGIPSLDFLMA
jgi:hypothetical protein